MHVEILLLPINSDFLALYIINTHAIIFPSTLMFMERTYTMHNLGHSVYMVTHGNTFNNVIILFIIIM